MPVDYNSWRQSMIDAGLLPDENGWYYYIVNEEKMFDNLTMDETTQMIKPMRAIKIDAK